MEDSQIKKFKKQVDEFNELVQKIDTYKNKNKEKMKYLFEKNTNWQPYENTAWNPKNKG